MSYFGKISTVLESHYTCPQDFTRVLYCVVLEPQDSQQQPAPDRIGPRRLHGDVANTNEAVCEPSYRGLLIACTSWVGIRDQIGTLATAFPSDTEQKKPREIQNTLDTVMFDV